MMMTVISLRVHPPQVVPQNLIFCSWRTKFYHLCKCWILSRTVCLRPTKVTQDLCGSVLLCYRLCSDFGAAWLPVVRVESVPIAAQSRSETDFTPNTEKSKCYVLEPFGG